MISLWVFPGLEPGACFGPDEEDAFCFELAGSRFMGQLLFIPDTMHRSVDEIKYILSSAVHFFNRFGRFYGQFHPCGGKTAAQGVLQRPDV